MKKVGLAGLMGLGVFAGACAIKKTLKIPELTARSDFTWETVDLLIWTGSEVFTIVLAACIPTIRPLFLDLSVKIRKSFCGSVMKEQEPQHLERLPRSGHARRLSSRISRLYFFLDSKAPGKTFPTRQTTEWAVASQTDDQIAEAAACSESAAPSRKPLSADDSV